jgi:hypothetical protein
VRQCLCYERVSRSGDEVSPVSDTKQVPYETAREGEDEESGFLLSRLSWFFFGNSGLCFRHPTFFLLYFPLLLGFVGYLDTALILHKARLGQTTSTTASLEERRFAAEPQGPMDRLPPIFPPGFRPTDGFGPGGFPGDPNAPQTVQPPPSQSQPPQTMASMTVSLESAPTKGPNQPPVGGSSSIDLLNFPSVSVLSGASVTASSGPGSSSTLLGLPSESAVSTLFNSASIPISTLFNSAAGAGASIVTSTIALSTTTTTATPKASASAAKAADGTDALTSATPGPVLKDQTIVGVAVGIGIWLLIIIAALSWCLWRKRKIQRERGERLDDDDAALMPPDMSDMDGIAGMARTTQRPRVPQRAPSIPPPAFMSRANSSLGNGPGPLGSHPVSRDGITEMPALSFFSYDERRVVNEPARSPSTIFPGAQRLSQYSPRHSLSESIGTTHRSIVKMRALSIGPESPTTPEPVSELPPSLGKLNSWLEENRRRSRMTASGSGTRDPEPQEERRRAESPTLGDDAITLRPGPGARPISLTSLKEAYRNSATLQRSIKGSIRDREVFPGKMAT